MVLLLGRPTPSQADGLTFVQSPSASAERVAFIAHGDLWSAPPRGGQATRLVHSTGSITAARLSPDGRWVAYTDRVDGVEDLLVVAASGGQPRRLTFDASKSRADNTVLGWTPDSRKVVFLSSRGAWASGVFRAFVAPIEGGIAALLPLDQVGSLSFSPDGQSVAYTRTRGDPNGRKRYLGGQAEDIYIYYFSTRALRQITTWRGTDTAPLWVGSSIYFVSDRGACFRRNIWKYDLRRASSTQVTHFCDYDVGTPAAGGGRILFGEGGRPWSLKLADQTLQPLTFLVPDDGARTAPRTSDVSKDLRLEDATGGLDFTLAPDGKSAVFAAHGDLFHVSLPAGEADNLTRTPGVNEDHPIISPDGRDVAYVTEVDGAEQIAIRSLHGGGEHVLSHFATGVFFGPTFSSDGKFLAVPDAEHNLWLLRRSGGEPTRVAFDAHEDIRDAAFSPDGKWLAFSTHRTNDLQALHLFDLASRTDIAISKPLESDRSPVFSPDSSTLFSSRDETNCRSRQIAAT